LGLFPLYDNFPIWHFRHYYSHPIMNMHSKCCLPIASIVSWGIWFPDSWSDEMEWFFFSIFSRALPPDKPRWLDRRSTDFRVPLFFRDSDKVFPLDGESSLLLKSMNWRCPFSSIDRENAEKLSDSIPTVFQAKDSLEWKAKASMKH